MQAVPQEVTLDEQDITSTKADATSSSMQVTITFEFIAIVFLVVVSLMMRVLSLDAVPIASSQEAQQALSAWRYISPEAPGNPITSDSPVTYWAQVIAFGLSGGSEASARAFTALAGVLLSISPLLFRGLLGKARAYVFALLLTFSPVLLAASRLGGMPVWSLLFAVLGLWGMWRFIASEDNKQVYAVLSTLAFGALLLLSEPGGMILGLILLIAGGIALYLTALEAPDDADMPGSDFLQEVRQRFSEWPLITAVGITTLVIVAFSTGFLLDPGGLGMVAAVLDGFLAGFTNAEPGTPLFFPLTASLYYELVLWILALIGVVTVINRDDVTLVERFLLAWTIVAIFASLIYRGGTAAHALWLVVPLAGLAAYAINYGLTQSSVSTLFTTTQQDSIGKWVIAITIFTLLIMTLVQFQIVSRSFLSVPEGSIAQFVGRLDEPGFAAVARSLIWLFISILFMIFGYFLAASVWGYGEPNRGVVLGIFGFLLLTNVATGWNVAVFRADDARELWHIQATNKDAPLVRETLLELADRETFGFNYLPVVAVADDNGIIAWTLRDFRDAVFVDDLTAARTAEVIIVQTLTSEVDLGGSYLGQAFTLTETWNADLLQGFDILPWFAVRETRAEPIPSQAIVLWVRQDIFESEPFQTNSPPF